jgi:hypothetical protein
MPNRTLVYYCYFVILGTYAPATQGVQDPSCIFKATAMQLRNLVVPMHKKPEQITGILAWLPPLVTDY